MRVLHIYRTYYPDTQGGLEEVIRQICHGTRQHGIESRVLSLSRFPEPAVVEREEATVFRAKLTVDIASCGMSVSAFNLFSQLSRWADIIHYHFPWPFADLLHYYAKVRTPTVLTYHSDIVRQRLLGFVYRPLMRRFLGDVDRIICTSENYFATSNVLSDFSHKVEVIPIGIDETTIALPPATVVEDMEKEFGRDFFLFVGVLRYYKGLHILLDSLQGAQFRVVIVGSGPIEAELRRQADRLNLTNVQFAGYLPDTQKHALFKLCRGIVFPSYLRSEAFGVTLLEGAMHAKPLISTEVGSGTSHVNIDGETGRVIPPASSRALRTAMEELYRNQTLAAEMGARARLRFEALFTGKIMSERYASVYNTLALENGTRTEN